jgi:hypothetical protein
MDNNAFVFSKIVHLNAYWYWVWTRGLHPKVTTPV